MGISNLSTQIDGVSNIARSESNFWQKRPAHIGETELLEKVNIEEFLPEAILERNFYLENGKCISRIWIEKTGLSINNKKNWEAIFDFFNESMSAFEHFYLEYEEYIKDLETNT